MGNLSLAIKGCCLMNNRMVLFAFTLIICGLALYLIIYLKKHGLLGHGMHIAYWFLEQTVFLVSPSDGVLKRSTQPVLMEEHAD